MEAALGRIETKIGSADFDLIKKLVATFAFVIRLLQVQRTTIGRLRRFFGFSSEKTAAVLDESKASSAETAPEDVQTEGDADPSITDDDNDWGPSTNINSSKPKAKGHGRAAASDYETARHIPVAHDSLSPGQPCPACGRGKVYDLNAPAQVLRIVGQPVLAAMCWDCQRLRCNACGKVYTARGPAESQGPKFDDTAVSMLALCHYGAGLPFNRLERLQQDLQTPVPSSTQWDVLKETESIFQPVLGELERQAAQGDIVHDDDTYARILAFMGKRRAALLKNGELPNPERTGLFTTAIISMTISRPIALFYTGRKYAGENLADLLKVREVDLEPPILMSDALSSRNVPKGHTVIESNCMAHARRGIVDQIPNFPADCKHVLEELRKIFFVEAQCKKKGLCAEDRLRVHQRLSGPVMNALRQWMLDELAAKRVEPNSGLGQAYNYMLNRWDKFTVFLRKVGAPIENNIAERTIKKAICHRRNSLFYRSQNGARVGDMFMSLIHTAELHSANPFDYLTEVQRHAQAAAEHPAAWMPWNYRETLARLTTA